MSKMPIAWHQECLKNRIASLEREEAELVRLEEVVDRGRRDVRRYRDQLSFASANKLDGFDADLLLKPKSKTKPTSASKPESSPARSTSPERKLKMNVKELKLILETIPDDTEIGVPDMDGEVCIIQTATLTSHEKTCRQFFLIMAAGGYPIFEKEN